MTETITLDIKSLRKTNLKKELQNRGIETKTNKKNELLLLLKQELEKEGIETKKKPTEKPKKEIQKCDQKTSLEIVKMKTNFTKLEGQLFCVQISDDERNLIVHTNKKKNFIPFNSILSLQFPKETQIHFKTEKENFEFSTENKILFENWKQSLRYLIVEKKGGNLEKSKFIEIPKEFIVGVPQFFWIESFDIFDKKVHHGNDKWKVSLDSQKKNIPPIQADVVNFDDGTFKVGFVIYQSGEYNLNISLRSDHFQVENITVLPHEIVLKNSIIQIESLIQAGKIFEANVVMKDQYLNNVCVNQKDLKMFIQSESFDCSTLNQFTNIFQVEMKTCGSYEVEIFYLNQLISKTNLKIVHSSLSLENFEMLNFSEITTSLEENCFEMIFYDSFGNKYEKYENLSIEIENSESTLLPCRIEFVESVYKIKYIFLWMGEYKMRILLGNTKINKNPISIQCQASFDEQERLKKFETDRLKRIEEENERKELDERYQLLATIESKIEQRYPDWLSFKNLLNRLFFDLFPLQNFQQYFLGDHATKDEIMKIYRKLLFSIHPDQLNNPTLHEKLENEVLFNKLQHAVERYRKWN
jgi:hypothetical protein